MNKALLTIGLALVAGVTAHADLGDTYAQSCAKYGSSGRVNKTTKSASWRNHNGTATIVETFVKNECVRITLFPNKGRAYSIADVEQMLPYEAGNQRVWVPLQRDNPKFVASWETSDSLLVASLYPDGACQFAYKWWLERKGLIESGATFATAPIEDDEPGISM
jgi:hypothetical protein